ncbi:cell wall protein [Diaporthe amygdali]|uniref:cell wall protein n=1 Tax=Phomopsis amygdali TaxID=1214568 RepID=UPI0022FE503B|nr:cell wall protein [Diaporthe amygdali]KAJ0114867.1 cell wall protein [Diaporthe amygdali]
MKYSFTVAALAAGAYATNLPRVILERDLATIQGVIGDVSTKLQALNTAAQSFSGDASALTSASSDLSSTIKSGTSTVQGTDALTLTDAVSLQSTVQGLQGNAQTLVDNLSSKKSAIEQAGLCDTVLQQSQGLSTDSQALIDAVVSKVPQEAQSIAQNLVAGFTATLQQNQANFAQGNCTNASGGSGGGGSTPTSTGSGSSPSSAKSSSTKPTATGGGGGSSGGSNATRTTGAGGATPTSSTPATFTGAAVANAVPVGLLGLLALLL